MVMTTVYSGNGLTQYAAKSISRRVYHTDVPIQTDTFTLKAGNILKAGTLLEAIPTAASADIGKVRPHAPFVEGILVQITTGPTASGNSLTIAGLVFTVNSATVTIKQVVDAFAGLYPGGATPTLSYGTFSGTLAGFSIEKVNDTTLEVSSVTPGSNVTDATISSSGIAIDTDLSTGATILPVVGILEYDVAAQSADQEVSVITQGSFYDSVFTWASDPDVDKVTLANGTTVAVSSGYNTGLSGTSAYAKRLKTYMLYQYAPFLRQIGFETTQEYKLS